MPADLADHVFIGGPAAPASHVLTFSQGNTSVDVPMQGRVKATVNDGAVALAVAGVGVVTTGLWGSRAELADGRLERLLGDWSLGLAEVNLVLPGGRRAKASAKALVDYLVSEFATAQKAGRE